MPRRARRTRRYQGQQLRHPGRRPQDLDQRRGYVHPRCAVAAGALEPVEQHGHAGAARSGQDGVVRRGGAAEQIRQAPPQLCLLRSRPVSSGGVAPVPGVTRRGSGTFMTTNRIPTGRSRQQVEEVEADRPFRARWVDRTGRGPRGAVLRRRLVRHPRALVPHLRLGRRHRPRPPGVLYGPFESTGGCLLFESHYYTPRPTRRGRGQVVNGFTICRPSILQPSCMSSE